MAHKKKHGGPAPVPPANRPNAGPSDQTADGAEQVQDHATGGAPFQEQDPKRRLGDFSGAGEHPFQQPGGRNDANH